MQELWDSYLETRCEADFHALVDHYSGFVSRIAGYISSRISFLIYEEAFGDGLDALCDCIERYDPNIAKFETFATQRVRGAVIDGVRSRSRHSRAMHQKYQEGERAVDDFFKTHGFYPTPEELDVVRRPNKIGLIVAEPEVVSPLETVVHKDAVEYIFDLCNPREQALLEFFLNGNDQSVMDYLGCSQDEVATYYRSLFKDLSYFSHAA